MSPDTKTEVGRIAATICDGLCHWPRILEEAELSEKCDSCRPIIDIANLAEKLEGAFVPCVECTFFINLPSGTGCRLCMGLLSPKESDGCTCGERKNNQIDHP